jgi:hypothetical protein
MGKNGTVSILTWKFLHRKKTFHTRMKCASSFYTWEFDFSFGTVYRREELIAYTANLVYLLYD